MPKSCSELVAEPDVEYGLLILTVSSQLSCLLLPGHNIPLYQALIHWYVPEQIYPLWRDLGTPDKDFLTKD